MRSQAQSTDTALARQGEQIASLRSEFQSFRAATAAKMDAMREGKKLIEFIF